MGAIELKNIEKSFGDLKVIKDISLAIDEGEFVVFVGPSGCGKSTLLRIIAGLEDATEGHVFIEGHDVTKLPPYDRKLSMVFQSYALYPHMNVRQNMEFGLKTAGLPKTEIEQKIAAATKVLQLEPYLDRLPKQLSGGQRQRVAIGRAIVREPVGFLFDEPLSNLDASLRVDMRLEIARLHKTLGATMIYVTHDQVEAMTLADKIVVMKDGEIMQVGAPRQLYEKPENLFVAQFLGSPKMNILPCLYNGSDEVQLEGNAVFSTGREFERPPVQMGIRPEQLSLSTTDDCQIKGRIEMNEYLGTDNIVHIDAHALGRINLRVGGNSNIVEGEEICLRFDPTDCCFFDNSGQAV